MDIWALYFFNFVLILIILPYMPEIKKKFFEHIIEVKYKSEF